MVEAATVFERGDVVYGADPFKGVENARPWLVLSNHEGRPFYGEQYIAVTLTSNLGWTGSSKSLRRAGSVITYLGVNAEVCR